jgi:hypothetical protein
VTAAAVPPSALDTMAIRTPTHSLMTASSGSPPAMRAEAEALNYLPGKALIR